MIDFQSSAVVRSFGYRPCHSPSPRGEGRDEGELCFHGRQSVLISPTAGIRVHSYNSCLCHQNIQKTLQSKCISSYLKLIQVNQTYLGSLPPPPILSNLKDANNSPAMFCKFNSCQKSAGFRREKNVKTSLTFSNRPGHRCPNCFQTAAQQRSSTISLCLRGNLCPSACHVPRGVSSVAKIQPQYRLGQPMSG